jgi:RNA polymerase sigma-70 factor (ECF subfamily)
MPMPPDPTRTGPFAGARRTGQGAQSGMVEVDYASGADGGEREQELVERARTDSEAFAVLYRRYVGRIHGFVHRRSGSHETAEEVVAATFERAWRALPGFRWRGGGFEAWLFRIAANEMAGYYRRAQRASSPRAQMVLREMAEALADDDPGLVELLRGSDDRMDQLRRALGTLRPRYQEVIALRYLAGLDTDQAAAAMGCSKPVLAVTLHRALGALRRAVAREEGRG